MQNFSDEIISYSQCNPDSDHYVHYFFVTPARRFYFYMHLVHLVGKKPTQAFT